MQNMISLNKNGKPVSAFFDVNWEGKQITNVVIREGRERVSITPNELAVITDLIKREVTAILMESALDRAEGKEVVA